MFDAFREGDQWAVYKLDAEKHPIGSALKHVDYESDAIQYIATLTKQDEPIHKMYIAPRPAGLFSRRKTGITVIKGADGLRYMLIVTSNSYKDRDDETITTKALKRYVDAAWAIEGKCVPENVLMLWHREIIGDIVFADMEGPFLFEVAKERANRPITVKIRGKYYRTTVKHIWDAIESANIRWGASHGFKYPDSAKTKDGTYNYIAKFETSILPLDAAANPYTFAGVIDEMNRDKFLENLLRIPGFSKSFRKGINEVNSELQKQGLQHKNKQETAVKGMLEDAQAVLEEALGKIGTVPEGFAAEVLQNLIAKLTPVAEAAAEVVETEYMEEEPMTEMPVDEEMAKALKLLPKLLDSNKELAEGNRETREAVITIAKAVGNMASVPDAIADLTNRVKALEARTQTAPRRASQDTSTAIKDDALTQIVKEQTQRFDELFPGSGIKVRSESK